MARGVVARVLDVTLAAVGNFDLDYSGNHKGFGWIVFATEGQAEQALSVLNYARIDGREVTVDWANDAKQERADEQFPEEPEDGAEDGAEEADPPPTELPAFLISADTWREKGALTVIGVQGIPGDQFYALHGDMVLGTFQLEEANGQRTFKYVDPPWVGVRRELIEKRDGWFAPVDGGAPRISVVAFAEAAKQGGVREPAMRLQRALDASPEPGTSLHRLLVGEAKLTDQHLAAAISSLTAASKAVDAQTNAERPIVRRAAEYLERLQREQAALMALQAAVIAASAAGAEVRIVGSGESDPAVDVARKAAVAESARILAEAAQARADSESAAQEAEARAERAAAELSAARDQIAELEGERAAAKKERDAAKRNAKKAAEELAGAAEELAAHRKAVEALQKRAASLRRLIADGGDDPVPESPLPVVDLASGEDGCQPFVAELAGRGLDYPSAWALRFLLAVLAARRVGALVLLAGSTGTGKTQIVRTTSEILEGAGTADIPVRPDWLNAADLLGYVDPLRGLFSPSDFVTAVRAARRLRLRSSDGAPPPYLLLLDELNLARVENFGADLLSILERPPGPARSIRLYPQDQNKIWLAELRRLSNEGAASSRRDELKAFFDPANTAETDPQLACRLLLPDNLVVCGTLNTDRHTQELSPKVLDRALVLQSPPLDVVRAFTATPVARSPLRRLRVPPAPEADPRATHPRVFAQLQHATALLGGCGVAPSRRMVRAAEAVVAEAARWWRDDPGPKKGVNELTAGLLHMLLIPRIEAAPADAHKPLDELAKWLEGLVPGDHDVLLEVHELRDRAKASGRYGDLRGLR